MEQIKTLKVEKSMKLIEGRIDKLKLQERLLKEFAKEIEIAQRNFGSLYRVCNLFEMDYEQVKQILKGNRLPSLKKLNDYLNKLNSSPKGL